jgi:hypothetical protein
VLSSVLQVVFVLFCARDGGIAAIRNRKKDESHMLSDLRLLESCIRKKACLRLPNLFSRGFRAASTLLRQQPCLISSLLSFYRHSIGYLGGLKVKVVVLGTALALIEQGRTALRT